MDLCEVASIHIHCFPGIELNVIEDILLSMKSNHILHNVLPGEIVILYKEDESYIYARNDGNGLVIEMAFVPDTQVKRTNNHHDHLYEAELEKRAQVIGDKLRAGKEDGNSFKVVIETVTE